MSQKKVVGRNVAIALGIICIVFVAALIGAVAQYTSIINARDKTIATKDSDIQALQAWLDGNKTYANQLFGWLNDNITAYNQLQSEYNALEQTANLGTSVNWVSHVPTGEPHDSYYYWIFQPQYAGYVVVSIESSDTSYTYVEVIYSSHGANYDTTVHVGTTGTPAFPILPISNLEIRVGNNNPFWITGGGNQVVTITYYY